MTDKEKCVDCLVGVKGKFSELVYESDNQFIAWLHEFDYCPNCGHKNDEIKNDH